jgi:hypothetical protein
VDLIIGFDMILTEGKKDDLYRKFQDVIEAEKEFTSNRDEIKPPNGYDFFITDEFVKKTNFKYLDFLLTVYYFMNDVSTNPEVNDYINSSMQDAQNLIKQVKLFDRFPALFRYKDINEYSKDVPTSYMQHFEDDYLKALKRFEEKEATKKTKKDDVEVLYNQDGLLIIKPLSTAASCLYGKTTKWCTAATYQNQFQNYSQKGDLYYVIDNTLPEKVRHLGKYAVYHKLINNQVTVFDSHDSKIPFNHIPKKAQEIIGDIIKNQKYNQLDFLRRWFRGFTNISRIQNGMKVTVEDVQIPTFQFMDTSDIKLHLDINGDYKVTVSFELNKNEIESNYQNFSIPYKILVLELDKDSPLQGLNMGFGPIVKDRYEYQDNKFNVVGNIENIPQSYFINKILNTIKNVIKSDYTFWTAQNVQSKYSFTKPKGTLAEKFTNYIINSEKEGQYATKKGFLEKLFKERNRDISDMKTQGYISLFFASIKDAGIVKLNRNTSGTPKFYYTLGDNYDKWKQGKLKRV